MGTLEWKGYWFKYEHKLARHGIDICLATTNPEKYCNGYYQYSRKDLGSGKEYVIVNTNDPSAKLLLIEQNLA